MRRVVLMAPLAYAVAIFALVVVERRDPSASIHGVGDAVWYSAVTLTTVGYGDMYPVTPLGRLIGVSFLLGSVGVLGVFVAEVSQQVRRRWEERRMGLDGTDFRDHVVILGWDRTARAVVRELMAAGRRAAIVTGARDELELIHNAYPSERVFALLADLDDLAHLDLVNITESEAVLVNLSDDARKLITILNLKQRYPGLNIIVLLENRDLQSTFYSAGVTYVLSKNEMASKLLASYVFEPAVAEYTADLITTAERADDFDIQQYFLTPDGMHGLTTYGDLFSTIRERFGSVVIGLQKAGDARHGLLKMPPDDTRLEAGDYAIVITNGAQAVELKSYFGVAEGVVSVR